jgi:hypothetical protein
MNPISGTSSRTYRPSCRCRAPLHCRFFERVVGVAVGVEVHVHSGVPLAHVDAVHDALQLPVVLVYDVVQFEVIDVPVCLDCGMAPSGVN